MPQQMNRYVRILVMTSAFLLCVQPLINAGALAQSENPSPTDLTVTVGSPTPMHVVTAPPTPSVQVSPETSVDSLVTDRPSSENLPAVTATMLPEIMPNKTPVPQSPYFTEKFDWSTHPYAIQFESSAAQIFEKMNGDTEINKEQSPYFRYVQSLIEFQTLLKQIFTEEASQGHLSKADVYFDLKSNQWKLAKGTYLEAFDLVGEYLGQVRDGKANGYGAIKIDGKQLWYFGYFEKGTATGVGLFLLGDQEKRQIAFGFTPIGQFTLLNNQSLEIIQYSDVWTDMIQNASDEANLVKIEESDLIKEQGLLFLSGLAYAEIPKSLLKRNVVEILSKLPVKEKQKITSVAYRDSAFTKWLEDYRLMQIIDERDYFQKKIKAKLAQTGLYGLVFEKIKKDQSLQGNDDLVIVFRGTRIGSKGFNSAVAEKDWLEISKMIDPKLFIHLKSKLLDGASPRSWFDRKIHLTGHSGGGLLAQGVTTAMLSQGVSSEQIQLITFNGIAMQEKWLQNAKKWNGFDGLRSIGINWLVEGEWSSKKLLYDDRVGLTRVIPNVIYQTVEESLKNTLGPSFYHSIDRFFEFYNAGLVDRTVPTDPIDWVKTVSAGVTVKGTKVSEYLTGTAWSDRLVGDGGADRLEAGEGGNVLDAGMGSDQMTVDAKQKEISEPPIQSNRCYTLKLVEGNAVCDYVLMGKDQDTDVLMILNGHVLVDQIQSDDRIVLEQTKFATSIQLTYHKKSDRLKIAYIANGRSGKLWISNWRELASEDGQVAILRFVDGERFAEVTIDDLNQATKTTKTIIQKLKFSN